MTDIVERLRTLALDYRADDEIKEAADEIDRLRGLLRETTWLIECAGQNEKKHFRTASALKLFDLRSRIDAALDTNSAANRVASSALGQGAEVGAESHSALNPLEGVARAEVVATPGTPGGGAVADRIQDGP